MAKFVPYAKRTRKQQRALDQEKRGSWGTVNPVTRCADRSDAYSRNKENRRWRADARKEHATHGGFAVRRTAVAA